MIICKNLSVSIFTYHITVLILLAGVEVILPNGLKEIAKGTMFLSADDRPGEAVIKCMKHFNGSYSCQLCLQEDDPLANAPMVINKMTISDAEEGLKIGGDVNFS